MAKALIIMALLSGCAKVHYLHKEPTGAVTEIQGYSVLTDAGVDGLRASDSDKSRSITLTGGSANQTDAMEAIVRGAIQGAALAVKP